jgi:proteasome lid subunit RPN8/RPN11
MENIAEDPGKSFFIDNKVQVLARRVGIDAIVHSHVDYPQASASDILSQKASGLPWVIVSVEGGIAKDVFILTDGAIERLEN